MPGNGDPRSRRRHRARSLGGLFAAGAMLSTIAIVLPGWPQANRPGIAATVVLAAGGAGILVRFADRITDAACQAFLVAGTLLIAACQVLVGADGAAGYALLYVWVALHAALFFGPRTVAAQLALCTVAQAIALQWLDDRSSLAPQIALTLGTQVAAALVVGSLAGRLRRLADTDALTGVGNRRRLEDALDEALSGAGGGPVCLAVLDLDGFKEVNDRLGHAAGDSILMEAAAVWGEVIGPGDTLARTGGDEFMVVMPDRRMESAAEIVQRLVATTPEGVSCCAGLARWDGRESAERLATRADQALYAAKRDGGGGVVRATAGHLAARSA